MDDLNNDSSFWNIPFLHKSIKRVVVDQLQVFLVETDSLDPFQLGLRTRYSIETVLVTLQANLLKEADKSSWIFL